MSVNNTGEAFKSQQKVAFLSLLSELPNVIAQLVFMILSGSLMIALDAVDSLCNFIQAGLSFLLSKKLQGDDSFKYDYGMGKIEAFGSFISAAFLYVGVTAVFAASVYSIIFPSAPQGMLFLAIFLKIINVAVDVFLLRKQIKTVKGVSGSFIASNTVLLKKNLIFDSVALFVIAISFLLRNIPAISYFEPVACIVCAVIIAAQNSKIISGAASDLLDKTLDEETQLKILKCVSKIWKDIAEFNGVRTRRSGHIIYIDLMVSFEGGSSYSEIRGAYETFDTAVKEILPDSVSAIVITEVERAE